MKINISTTEIKDKVLHCLADHASLSLVRLGDGEMIITNNDVNKIDNFCIKQIGRKITNTELLSAQQNILQSVLNCNILGLPTAAHCKKNILWKKIIYYYDNVQNSYPEEWISKDYCSINSHLDLLYRGDIFSIFKELTSIVIVSSRDIVARMQKKYPNIKNIEWHSIPAEQRYEVVKNQKINIFDELENISNKLVSTSRYGQLLIFGSGPFGKHLGTRFASAGGVALDLGSVFDLFVGKHTRGPGKGSTAQLNTYLL